MDLVKARTRQAKLEVALQILQDEIWKQEEKVTNNQRALYRVRTTRPKRHPGHHLLLTIQVPEVLPEYKELSETR